MYGALVLLGYAEWSSPWISPLCMGLAIGTKQIAWFFLPLLLRSAPLRLAGNPAAGRHHGGDLSGDERTLHCRVA